MIKKISNSLENSFKKKVVALYESAFPPDERRRSEEFLRLVEEEPLFQLDIFVNERDEFVGFFTKWVWDDFRYGEHFAVSPEFRGGGYGREILEEEFRDDNRPLLLEVELPENEMARRRIGFYQRNGFRLWEEIPYVQPSYSPGLASLEMKLMTRGDIELTADDERIRRFRRCVYGV